MRKGDYEAEKEGGKKKKKTMEMVPTNVVSERQPTGKHEMAIRGPQNGRRALESGPILGYWAF